MHVETLKSYYGDRIDISEPRKFTIHFPEINLTDDYGNKHLIRDLFFIVNGSSFRVVRTTYTFHEFYNGYLHSHAGESCGKVSGLCLGNSDLAGVQSALCYDDKIVLDELETLSFIWYLQVYLEGESTSTKPYRYISDFKSILLKDTSDIEINFKNYSQFPYKFNGKNVIFNEKEFYEFFSWAIITNNISATSLENLKYSALGISNNLISKLNEAKNFELRPPFVFKGQQIKYKIIEFPELEKLKGKQPTVKDLLNSLNTKRLIKNIQYELQNIHKSQIYEPIGSPFDYSKSTDSILQKWI